MNREDSLWTAQLKATALFQCVVDRHLIQAGVLESDLSDHIHELARDLFGLRRHWHRRVVRSGPNTLLGYYDAAPDRRIEGDDLVYLDFGPVFGDWEADFGRSYVLGSDPRKHQLVKDIEEAFRLGQNRFETEPDLTAGQLYDYVSELAVARGWSFGARTAGHLVDEFPHARDPDKRFSIRSGNPVSLRETFEDGSPRHWILEIHFVDRARQFGGFLEELLTIRDGRRSV